MPPQPILQAQLAIAIHRGTSALEFFQLSILILPVP
jgi:hypothetical protein